MSSNRSEICAAGPIIRVVPESGMAPHGESWPLTICEARQKSTGVAVALPTETPRKSTPQCAVPMPPWLREPSGGPPRRRTPSAPSLKHIENRLMFACCKKPRGASRLGVRARREAFALVPLWCATAAFRTFRITCSEICGSAPLAPSLRPAASIMGVATSPPPTPPLAASAICWIMSSMLPTAEPAAPSCASSAVQFVAGWGSPRPRMPSNLPAMSRARSVISSRPSLSLRGTWPTDTFSWATTTLICPLPKDWTMKIGFLSSPSSRWKLEDVSAPLKHLSSLPHLPFSWHTHEGMMSELLPVSATTLKVCAGVPTSTSTVKWVPMFVRLAQPLPSSKALR
mmetsp:Transcript_106401/g.296926  ORF Transcript_106401/g.296926 Transcript_106401/m.296926 type:complete len:342 (-) Transcript_106401:70-1095(-)